MTKSELVQALVKKNPHLLQRDIDKVVTTVFDEITNAMARGQRVELRGFGVFSVKHREPRTGRNPRTGQSVKVAPKAIPFFKIGKTLHMLINGETPPVGKPRGRKKANATA